MQLQYFQELNFSLPMVCFHNYSVENDGFACRIRSIICSQLPVKRVSSAMYFQREN